MAFLADKLLSSMKKSWENSQVLVNQTWEMYQQLEGKQSWDNSQL